MQLVMRFVASFCSSHRFHIRGDRFVPIADTGKNMRGHMLRMRRCRCDLRIPPSCIKPFLCERRRVVEMNEVVSDTGMTGLALEDRLENRSTLVLHCIGLVARWGRDIDLDRI